MSKTAIEIQELQDSIDILNDLQKATWKYTNPDEGQQIKHYADNLDGYLRDARHQIMRIVRIKEADLGVK